MINFPKFQLLKIYILTKRTACICYFITCQTASQPDQYQAHFTLCGTWNDVMQDLEEMDSLDDFKTYFDS